MASFEEKKTAAVELIKRIHAGQTRSGGRVPAWYHMARVSRILELVLLDDAKEGTAEERESIILAGLGHDSLEDTDVTEAELERYFGSRGLAMIKGMTNPRDDSDHSLYIRQVAGAEEAVRLVKFADLIENCASVAYSLDIMGVEWTRSFFLPIVAPMIAAVMPTDFPTYPAAAAHLKDLVKVCFGLLQDEIKRFEDDDTDPPRSLSGGNS